MLWWCFGSGLVAVIFRARCLNGLVCLSTESSRNASGRRSRVPANPSKPEQTRANPSKPEPLKGEFSGWWSRRFDREQRLVYRVRGGALEIAQCRYHF
ncbi:MAG: type II toxin-antitoxin system YoeB family toxin [Limibaculum sp.]